MTPCCNLKLHDIPLVTVIKLYLTSEPLNLACCKDRALTRPYLMLNTLLHLCCIIQALQKKVYVLLILKIEDFKNENANEDSFILFLLNLCSAVQRFLKPFYWRSLSVRLVMFWCLEHWQFFSPNFCNKAYKWQWNQLYFSEKRFHENKNKIHFSQMYCDRFGQIIRLYLFLRRMGEFMAVWGEVLWATSPQSLLNSLHTEKHCVDIISCPKPWTEPCTPPKSASPNTILDLHAWTSLT